MNELISYNDSLILRELGFDEACFAWYSNFLERSLIFLVVLNYILTFLSVIILGLMKLVMMILFTTQKMK